MIHVLNPLDGTSVQDKKPFPFKLFNLTKSPDDKRLMVTSCIPPSDGSTSPSFALHRLDIETGTSTEVIPDALGRRMKTSPTGTKALAAEIAGTRQFPPRSGLRSEKWSVIDIASGAILVSRTLPYGVIPSFRAKWSPNEDLIASRISQGHLIFSAKTLETLAFIPAKYYGTPAFNPEGTHICLCRSKNTKILPIKSVLSKYALPSTTIV